MNTISSLGFEVSKISATTYLIQNGEKLASDNLLDDRLPYLEIIDQTGQKGEYSFTEYQVREAMILALSKTPDSIDFNKIIEQVSSPQYWIDCIFIQCVERKDNFTKMWVDPKIKIEDGKVKLILR